MKNNIAQKIVQLLKQNLYTISIYLRQIAGTLILFIIARYLSIYDYGLFTSYKTISLFILIAANMGFESYILVSAKNNIEIIRKKVALFLFNALFIILITTFIIPITFLQNKLIFFLVFIRSFFDTTFFALILPYFQAKRDFKTISIINILYAFLITLLAIISYLFKFSLLKFLCLNITLGVFNFIQCLVISNINVLKNFNKDFNLEQYIDKSILSFILVNICYILYSQIPSIYISTILKKEQAALFFSAFTIANIVMLLINAQQQKIMPEFIDVKIKNSLTILKKEAFKIFIITSLIFLFFVCFGKLLLKILYFQDYYIKSYFILLILSLGNIFYGIGKIYITFMMAKQKTDDIWKLQIEAILVSIITLFIFHKTEIYAAAIAYFASTTYIGFRYMFKTRQILKTLKS